MKVITSLLSFLLSSLLISKAFALVSNRITTSASNTRLASSLAPEAPTRPKYDEGDKNDKKSNSVVTSDESKHNILITSEKHLNPDPTSLSSERNGPLSMSIEELSEELGGVGRARIVWDCYTLGIDPDHMFGKVIDLGQDDYETIVGLLPSQRRSQKLAQGTLDKLQRLYQNSYGGKNHGVTNVEGGVATLSYISRASDSTTKLLLKLSDGFEIETVIIPWKGKRSTLCISSQVGCRQGCTFCATGKMGKLRSLNTDEILSQMFFAQKICRLEGLPTISNVVFMGMGDASDNAQSVRRATEILTTRRFFSLGASKVTVSTVAPTPECFMEFASSPCVIAWSVHAVRDDLRKKLVPTTKYTMSELRQGLIDALLTRPLNFRSCMLEVALMKGINDRLENADELAEFTKVLIDKVPGIKPHINLIPFNDIGEQSPFKKPLPDDVTAFQKRLQSEGLYTHVRSTRGDDETAACGQLATTRPKKSKIKP